MAPSPLRRMRWSATASALAAVVAMFGATALASSLMAASDAGRSSSATKASLAAVTSVAARPTATTRPPLVATTSVERRPVRPPTTSSTTGLTVPTMPTNGILRPFVTATDVWFETTTGTGDPCGDFELWRVSRLHPEALVAVTADRRRLEGIDAATGSVLAVLATWDEESGRPAGDGVVDIGGGALPAVSPDGSTLAFARGRGCAPEVVLRDLASGAERTVPEERLADPSVTGLRWTADGSGVEVVGAGVDVVAVSPSGEDVASIVDGSLVVSHRGSSDESPVTRLAGYADVAW